MAGGVAPKCVRQALRVIKDCTAVNLARLKRDYKELDVNIVMATSHIELKAKEEYTQAIFAAVSATRSSADVAYCLHALDRRLSKTHNWAVALKTLILIHRALREVGPMFEDELVKYKSNNPTFLKLSHFNSANACKYSYWVQRYAAYMEWRVTCFCVFEYDLQTRTRDLETPALFEHLEKLQKLMRCILAFKTEGAVAHNFVIKLALSMVASDSVKVYKAVSDATSSMLEKFPEMKGRDGFRALKIYRIACGQGLRLAMFHACCKGRRIVCFDELIDIDWPSFSFVQVMEKYLERRPCDSTVRKDLKQSEGILIKQHKKEAEIQAEADLPPVLLDWTNLHLTPSRRMQSRKPTKPWVTTHWSNTVP